MAWQDCVDEIQRAAGRTLSDDELIFMQEQLQAEIKKRKAEKIVASSDEVTMQAAQDLAAKLKRAAFQEKKSAAKNFLARKEMVDFIKTNYIKDLSEGAKAFLVGSSTVRVGSMDSVANRQQEMFSRLLGGFVTDLDIAGVLKVLKSGAFDEDIFVAKWSLSDPNAAPYRGPAQAMEVAKIYQKYQDSKVKLENAAGADIRKLPGFVTHRNHDSLKIEKAGFEAWKNKVLPNLDLDRSFEGDGNPEDILKNIYNNIVSGTYVKAKDEITGFKGGALNIAKKLSAERVLHFKDARGEYAYFKEFGMGNLADAIVKEFEIAAQNIGLMGKMGTNPRDNFNRVMQELIQDKDIDPKQRAQLAKEMLPGRRLESYMAHLDGSTRIPANNIVAKTGAVTRTVQAASKLGAAVFASFSDIPVVGSEIAYQQGKSLFSGMATQLEEMTRGMNSQSKKLVYKNISVMMDGMVGSLFRVFDAEDNLPGNLSKIQQLFFKLNLQQPWTDAFRSGVARVMAHYLANVSNLPFDQIPKDTSRALSLYGIDAGKWEIIRKLPQTAADGRKYLTAEGINEVPDDVIGAYLSGQGKNPSPYNIRMMREEINSQLRTFYNSRVSIGQLEAGAQTKAFWAQGTRPGTIMHETLKFVGQFKQHPTSFIHKVLAREVYGKGSDTWTDALKNKNGELVGLAQLMVWTTVFGYLSLQAKELVKGRSPRVPEDFEGYVKLFQASMLQGGGLGIYGDFLFGEMRNRYGQSPLTTFMGPTAGTVSDVFDLYGRFKTGDEMAGQAVRTVLNNTPFYNLFYVKPVMDYLFAYRLQETLNPGYLRRMEQRIQKENNSTFLFPPSQYAQ